MIFFNDHRYRVSFPDALHEIDPDFLDRWVAPCLQEDYTFFPSEDADLSPLGAYIPTPPEELALEFSDIFQNTDLRAFIDGIVPLDEEAFCTMLQRAMAGEEEALLRLQEDFFPTILSVAGEYAYGSAAFLELAGTVGSAFKAAVERYVPGRFGSFRGFALWHLRIGAIRWVWEQDGSNPVPGSGRLPLEFRLRDPEQYLAAPGEVPAFPAVSTSAAAQSMRELRRLCPDAFAALMESMLPREVEILELMIREDSLLTLYDLGDRYGVTAKRIAQILNRFFRRCRSHRVRKSLEAAGWHYPF